MTSKLNSQLYHLSIIGVLSLAPVMAGAAVLALTDTELEDRFWNCDLLSTHQALPMDVGMRCATWMDELKQRRFGGDFNQFLSWWQAHKGAEHARRAATRKPGQGPVAGIGRQ